MQAGRPDPATVVSSPSSSSPASPRIVAASRRAHGPVGAAFEVGVDVGVEVGVDDCSLDDEDGSARSASSPGESTPIPSQTSSGCVFSRTSSSETPGASSTSLSARSPSVPDGATSPVAGSITSMTARSVMIRCTTRLPV
jgi:hypothetical protein